MPSLVWRFQEHGAGAVRQSLAGCNAELRQSIELSKNFGRAMAGIRGPRVGGIGGGGGAGGGRQYDAHVRARGPALQREAIAAERAAVKAHAQAEREKTRITKQEARARLATEREAARELTNFVTKHAREQKRAANDFKRRQDAAVRQRHRDSQIASLASKQGLSGAMGMFGLGGVGGLAMGGMVVGAGLSAAQTVGSAAYSLGESAVRRRAGLQTSAQRLAISGRGTGQVGINSQELIKDAEYTAAKVKGSKAEDILTGQAKFVQMTGDLDKARQFSKTMATASMATGASNEDMASVLATLQQKYGIESESEMQAAVAQLVGQGKSGAFEMGDAAQYFSELSAAGSRFGLDKGAKGVATLGGLTQIARTTTGSGAKASTGVQAMLRQLTAKAGSGKEDIKALTGAEVFTDKTHTKARDVKDVLVDVIGGAKGDQTKLQKIFGDEGMAGVSALITAYNDAQNALDKGAKETDKRAAGEKALRALLDKNINAQSNWGEVVQDATAAGSTMEATWTSVSETILGSVGESLQPMLDTIVKNIDPITAGFTKFGEGLGMAGEVAANAAASLGTLIKPEKGENENLSPAEAMKKFAASDQELAGLDAKEKRYGTLSGKDARRRSKLRNDRADIRDQLGLGDQYDEYVKSMKGQKLLRYDEKTGKPKYVEAKTDNFDEWAKKQDSYKAAELGAVKDIAGKPKIEPNAETRFRKWGTEVGGDVGGEAMGNLGKLSDELGSATSGMNSALDSSRDRANALSNAFNSANVAVAAFVQGLGRGKPPGSPPP